MKKIFILLFTALTVSVYGQDKYNYVHYDKLIELKGTDYVVATIENMGKMYTTNNVYLLFINTRNGQTKQIDFPKDANIRKVEQIKIDSLGINKVIVSANTVNLDNSKSIMIPTTMESMTRPIKMKSLFTTFGL
jgi:hypothetical protein